MVCFCTVNNVLMHKAKKAHHNMV